MRVSVDLGDVRAIQRAAEGRLRAASVADDMTAVLETAAANERRAHAYRNRTGRLEASTIGEVQRATSSEVRGVLVAGPSQVPTPYASFVAGRGLMTIDAEARLAEAALARIFGRALMG